MKKHDIATVQLEHPLIQEYCSRTSVYANSDFHREYKTYKNNILINQACKLTSRQWKIYIMNFIIANIHGIEINTQSSNESENFDC